MVVVLAIFLVVRLADLIIAGKVPLMFNSGFLSVMFWIETALFAAPIVMLARRESRERFQTMFTASVLMLLAGAVYRFNTYIVAYNPGSGWSYFPALPELILTLGVVALEIAIYIFIVKRFPIIGGIRPSESAQ
jgi:Ni/Fe-hydrogenase subunit HybB-like protein